MFQIKVQAKTIDELVNKLAEMGDRLTGGKVSQTVTPPVDITHLVADQVAKSERMQATADDVEAAAKVAAQGQPEDARMLDVIDSHVLPPVEIIHSALPLVLSEVANRTPPAKYLPSEEPLAPPIGVTALLVAPIGGAEVDSAGTPWDARIHGKDRNKVKTGTWRYKRGVDKTIIAGIETELRQQPAPVAPPVSVPPVQAISVSTPTLAPPLTSTLEVTSPPVETLESKGLHIPPPIERDPLSDLYKLEYFTENFVDSLTNLLKKGTLKEEYLESLRAYFNVDQIWSLNLEQKTLMFEEFVKNGIIKKVI